MQDGSVAREIVAAMVREMMRTHLASDRLDIRFVESNQALDDLIRFARPVALVIEAVDLELSNALEALRRTRERWPTTRVLVFCHGLVPGSRAIFELAKAGASGLLLRGESLDHALGTTESDWAEGILRSRALQTFSPRVRAFLRLCLASTDRTITVSGVALALGIHRKTLHAEVVKAGLTAPRHIVTWSRLLRAGALLSDQRRSVEKVALELGFGSGAALSAMIRRHAGVRTRDLRGQHGFEHMRASFVRSLLSQSESHASLSESEPTSTSWDTSRT